MLVHRDGDGVKNEWYRFWNPIKLLARAHVIRKGHGKAFSIERESSDLMMKIGFGDKTIAHIADVNKPVGFKAVMRAISNRFYVHVPRWADDYYEWGEEVILVITPLMKR